MKKMIMFCMFGIICMSLTSACVAIGNGNEHRQIYTYNLEKNIVEPTYPIKMTKDVYTTYRNDIEYAEECVTCIDYRPTPEKFGAMLVDPFGIMRPDFEKMSTQKVIRYVPVKRFKYDAPKTVIINTNTAGTVVNTVTNY